MVDVRRRSMGGQLNMKDVRTAAGSEAGGGLATTVARLGATVRTATAGGFGAAGASVRYPSEDVVEWDDSYSGEGLPFNTGSVTVALPAAGLWEIVLIAEVVFAGVPSPEIGYAVPLIQSTLDGTLTTRGAVTPIPDAPAIAGANLTRTIRVVPGGTVGIGVGASLTGGSTANVTLKMRATWLRPLSVLP